MYSVRVLTCTFFIQEYTRRDQAFASYRSPMCMPKPLEPKPLEPKPLVLLLISPPQKKIFQFKFNLVKNQFKTSSIKLETGFELNRTGFSKGGNQFKTGSYRVETGFELNRTSFGQARTGFGKPKSN